MEIIRKTRRDKVKRTDSPVPERRYKWIAIFVLGLAVMVMLLGAVKMLADLQAVHPAVFWTIIVIVGAAIAGGLTWLGLRVARRFKKSSG